MASIFSKIIAGEQAGVILHQDEYCVVLMDAFPMLPAHVLVIPREEVPRIRDLSIAVRNHLFEMVSSLTAAMDKAGLSNGDSNIVINDGKSAGQSVAHVHIHVVPRNRLDGFPFPALFTNVARKLIRCQANAAALQATAEKIADHLAKEIQMEGNN